MKHHTLLLLSAALLSSCGQLGPDSKNAPDPVATVARPSAPKSRPPLFVVPVDGLPVMGDAAALVTLVEFTDYQCPYCVRAEQTVHRLRKKYGRELRVVVAENPLPMHEHARDAALAALAADERGQFEAVHDALFAHPDSQTSEGLTKLGAELRLGPSFDEGRTGETAKTALARAATLAASLKVHGTPMFFVNGRKISGAQPMASFESVIEEELLHARQLVAAGVRPQDVYAKILVEARANPASADEEAGDQPLSFVSEAKTAGGAHFLGSREASRSIVLFTDFECPYCARIDARMRELAKVHPDVRVVLRHRPLPMHSHARLAAKAAIAAEAQGALPAYSALLFENQSALDRKALIGYAAKAGLDGARFERDLDAPETELRLTDDEALAKKFDVRGVPTSFVDGRRVVGAQSISTFEDALTSATQ